MGSSRTCLLFLLSSLFGIVCFLHSFLPEILAQDFSRLTQDFKDFRHPWDEAKKQVSVAIIGGGMSGVSAAYSLALSNKHGISDKNFDFVVYEAQDRIGGNAYTFDFPLDNGKTHPVDLAYCWNPTMDTYEPVRKLQRHFGIKSRKANQEIHILKEGVPLTAEENEKYDEECSRWMSIVEWCQGFPTFVCKIYYGTQTLRSVLKYHDLSVEFFTYRLYPVIRFVIVAGQKGMLLDAPAIAALTTYTSGWGSCYGKQLHGYKEWYTVQGGSRAQIDALTSEIGLEHFKLGAPVQSIRKNGKQYEVSTESGDTKTYDAVIITTLAHIAADMLGPERPAWLNGMTSEQVEVALHSDTSIIDPYDPDAIYQYRVGSTDHPAGAAVTIKIAEMHNDLHIGETRPLLTSGNMDQYPENKRYKFDGEVFRRNFTHAHFPSRFGFVRVSQGRKNLAHQERMEFASSWISWKYSHAGALTQGDEAAVRLGAQYDVTKHWRSPSNNDEHYGGIKYHLEEQSFHDKTEL